MVHTRATNSRTTTATRKKRGRLFRRSTPRIRRHRRRVALEVRCSLVRIKPHRIFVDSSMTRHAVFQESTGVDQGDTDDTQAIRTLRGDSDIIEFTRKLRPAPQESEAVEAVEAVVPCQCDARKEHSSTESAERRARGNRDDQETGDRDARRALLFRAESIARLSRQAKRNSEWDRMIDK
jgi:hypothetical protein